MSESESSIKTGIERMKIQNIEDLYGIEIKTMYETKIHM